MARRREKKGASNRGRRNNRAGESDDDMDSMMGDASDNDNPVEEVVSLEYKLTDIIGELAAKNRKVRTANLIRLAAELRATYCPEAVQLRLQELEAQLLQCVRKGDSNEVAAACTVIGLVGVTLGEAAADFCEEVCPHLIAYGKNRAKCAASRASVLRACGTLCFTTWEYKEAQDAMQVCEKLFSRKECDSTYPELSERPAEVIEAAVDCWAILATMTDTDLLAGELHDRCVPHLLVLLDHEALEVRSAAGEAIALVYSGVYESAEPQYGEAGAAAYHEQVDAEELITKLTDLATDSSKRRAKNDRRKQRALFRDIVATVESGEVPEETMTVGSEKETFQGWVHLLQLGRLREILEGGLQTHFTHNEDLGVMFGIEVELVQDAEEEKSKRQDKIWRSKESGRNEFRDRQRQRDRKQHHLRGSYIQH